MSASKSGQVTVSPSSVKRANAAGSRSGANTDLVRLPELFHFRFSVTVDDIRGSGRFEVQRQRLGWGMVRMKK